MSPRRKLAVALALVATAGLAGFAAVYSGVYNVAATVQHTAPVYALLDIGARRSIEERARHIVPPPLGDPAQVRAGLQCFQRHCVQCHGAPGVASGPAAMGLNPLPNNLAQTARGWSAAQLYWTTRHGLKMTGMPAWEFRMSDEQLWAVVAFLLELPAFTPADYAAASQAAGAQCSVPQPPAAVGNAERGRSAVSQYACSTCHRIPGIVGAEGYAGPSLAGFAQRKYLAGRLANTRENLVLWLQHPKEVSPLTLMPDLGVSAAHALDIAAFLATLTEPDTGAPPPASSANDAARSAIERYGCGACHAIPGVRSARGMVGPPLDRYARRVYIAGKFPHEPELLVRWIRDAPALAPGTAMPNVGVSESDARAIAGYLRSLR